MNKLLAALLALIAAPALAAPPAPSFSVDNASADEQGGAVTITVRKHGRFNSSPSTVTLRTLDGTAKAPGDYAATTQTLGFGANEVAKTVTIPLVKDTTVEANETFTVKIAAGTNARLYDGTAVVTVTDSYAPQPPQEPTVPPPPATEFPLVGTVPVVASGVDIAANTIAIPPANSGLPDTVGAFRFHCAPSHVAYDDPIIMPGKPGQFHHLHQFFGNTGANANSTYESLRKSGDSTCINALNRSAYWMPALLGKDTSGRDVVVVPRNINIYYKRAPKGSPFLAEKGLTSANLPRGLRYVFGFPDYPPMFKCISPEGWDLTGYQASMDLVLSKCPVGADFVASSDSPTCWDGKNLDSADHRSHVKYMFMNSWEGWTRCPDTHRVAIAAFTIQASYTITATDLAATWVFSSDPHLAPDKPRGTSFHADWFGAWEDAIIDRWHEWCIDKLLTCAAGNLGNGTMLKPTPQYDALMKQPPQRLPIPPRAIAAP